MAFVPPKDRVLEYSTSNSQTVFAVSGAADLSHNRFSASMSVGDTTIGGVVEPGVAFKSGILTYSTTNQVTVSIVKESKGTFSATGIKQVFMGQPAGYQILRDPATGNVAIGANLTPDSLLTINANTAASVAPATGSLLHLVGTDATVVTATIDGFGGVPTLYVRRAAGTLASKAAPGSGVTIFEIAGQTWDASAYATTSRIRWATTEAQTSGAHGSAIDFETTPNTTTVLTRGVRFQPSGGISIGAAAIAVDPGIGSLNMTGSLTVATNASITGTLAAGITSVGKFTVTADGSVNNPISVIDSGTSGLTWQIGPRVGTGVVTDFAFYQASVVLKLSSTGLVTVPGTLTVNGNTSIIKTGGDVNFNVTTSGGSFQSIITLDGTVTGYNAIQSRISGGAQQWIIGGVGGAANTFNVYAGPSATLSATFAAAGVTIPGTLDVAGSAVYGNIPQNSKSAAYTLVLADAQKHILHPSADTTARIWTIPANASVAFPIGTTITFVNQASAGVITIAITTDTMRLAGAGTTGSRTLAANGIATALKITSTEWIISGTGLT